MGIAPRPGIAGSPSVNGEGYDGPYGDQMEHEYPEDLKAVALLGPPAIAAAAVAYTTATSSSQAFGPIADTLDDGSILEDYLGSTVDDYNVALDTLEASETVEEWNAAGPLVGELADAFLEAVEVFALLL